MLSFKKVDRYSAAEKKASVPMPSLVNDYNRNVGGVDKVDENIGNYRIAFHDKKWYFPQICYLLNVCVNNAWLFSREGGYKHDMLYSTRDIVNDWLKTYGTPRAKPGPQASGLSQTLKAAMITDLMRFDRVNHFIVESEGKRRQRCKKCNSQTIFMCKKCKVQLHNKC